MSPLLLLLGCPQEQTPPPEEVPEPGPLQVGVARVRMPVPLGIGTVGYGGFGVDAPPSPFAEIYPGTTKIHDHPDFRAFVISRGPGFELVLLRSDTVGVFQQLRRAVVLELQERLGRDLDDALIIGATHTHSGPGRVLDVGGPFELIADRFLPEHYERLVDAMADAVELAYEDLRPGRVGYAFGYTDEGHDDRRCEDGLDYTNGTLPLVALEQEGQLVGLAVAYAVHGTVLGIEELTLSQDVSGGIEQMLENRFDHPVLVGHFNAWGADMSPSFPELGDAAVAIQPSGYDQVEAVGSVVADAAMATLPQLVWTEAPEIVSATYRVPVSREVLGYDAQTWTHPYGAVYCSVPAAEDCDPSTQIEGLDSACLPFTAEFPAPDRTEFTAGHLDDLDFVTFPGEPGTLLAERVMEEIGALGGQQVLFFGYAQDYTGYSILEEDWWQGGYEASGALWGPRQGEYLSGRAVQAWAWAHGEVPEGTVEPAAPFDIDPYTPYVPAQALDLGTVVSEVPSEVSAADEVVWVVGGNDPWLGAPLVTLLDATGAPVLRPNGLPVTSDGQAFWVELVPVPSYEEALELPSRAFHWSFHLALSHRVPGALPQMQGGYKLRADIPDGAGGTVTVESGIFVVTP
jgi:hypothetical protein